MKHRYLFGYTERAAGKSGDPIRFVATTTGRKADGLDLKMDGARLDRFNANPVIGFGHNFYGRTNLPIGRGHDVDTTDDQLLISVTFDQEDEFAREVERKLRGGFLNAVSVGFDPIAIEDDGTVTDWELFEMSVVPIPMDADAVVESGRVADLAAAVRSYEQALIDTTTGTVTWTLPDTGPSLDQIVEAVIERLSEIGADRTAPPTPTQVRSIPTTDAAGLLAAFDKEDAR